MKKRIALMIFFISMVGAFTIQNAQARMMCRGDRCPHGSTVKSMEKWDLEKMLFYKAHFILGNQEELGLSEDQVKTIKSLKLETKKSLLRQNVEIEVLALDIKAKLWEHPIDREGINKLIDQKYELKKAKAKSLIDAFAKLKATLTEEQMKKGKEIWIRGMKGHWAKKMKGHN
jgi:hypothetical protein